MESKYNKTICGIGYIGDGEYISYYKENGKYKCSLEYNYWCHMIKRCYDEKYSKIHTTYIGCTVCDEWLCFQTFAKWFEENYYSCNNEIMDLDKDILCKGNKLYSPDTCVFVPHRINGLFTKCDKARGDYPIGVTKKPNGKFMSRCGILNGRKHLGYFFSSDEAFYKYKDFKELYIKQVAEEYKLLIPFKLYEAMYKWQVEIND